jgi:hypothetical protein
VPGWNWSRLESVVVFLVGCGAIGSLLADFLASLGLRRFFLIDPKSYNADTSPLTQCRPEDAGRSKVEVVARSLRERGARVTPFRCPVELLEPGWLGPESVLCVSCDRRSAEITCNRLAGLARRPLYKINLEPSYLLGSFRFFDLSRTPIVACGECLLRFPEDYAGHTGVHSCDGAAPPGSGERATGSPRSLSALVASWGALTLVSTLVSSDARDALDGKELLFTALRPAACRELVVPPNPDCLAPHGRRGPLVRIAEGPGALSLQALAGRAGIADTDDVTVSGSSDIAIRAACDRCRSEVAGAWWVRRPGRPVSRCACGGRHHPIPFFQASSQERAALGDAWTAPLSRLGVGPRSAVTLATAEREATFLFGRGYP